jgi:hypothetical protein
MEDKKPIASSPERHTFQKEGYLKRAEEAGKEPEQDYLDWWEQIKIDEANKIYDPEWQKNNLEYDLRSTDWIVGKARASDDYAQNIYAALCNNEFMKLAVVPILKGETWSCSWRHAGGIVADMLEKGDYIDWYCSGINDGENRTNGYVPESVVTDEISEDFKKLGWIVVEQKEEQ